MTYNFDPDNWYRIEVAALEAEVREGRLTARQAEDRLAALDERCAQMWRRLDGSYRIPREVP